MARAGKQTFTGFVAKTTGEVAAFRTSWSCAHAKSIFAANHAVEELLPLHILVVALGQQGKMTLHQPGQFTSVAESNILP
jgi:hypothetical protein